MPSIDAMKRDAGRLAGHMKFRHFAAMKVIGRQPASLYREEGHARLEVMQCAPDERSIKS